ncbi:hypothetical protein [Pseudoxanthomonas sp. SE1]|uniref:hypothetical protein n=1 Tax=Pseudoxanthomonas sp. SE1 TaxID=1664560 RepID=UPI00240E23BA|nr:hypothetical protein [Pseudoxanthomonas sp. SE1]WFC40271.1 hypothetical protein OY559_10435 [Pseudoxanthomonas sp. SE1]WFC43726.1 hypothetical protein OY559_09615 [Pseudoxanthomonas sp. SE1]
MATATDKLDDSIFNGFRAGRTFIDFWLPRILALGASVIGPLPLVLDLKWSVSMSIIGPIFWLASILLTVASVALARRAGDKRFVWLVIVAFLAGYMATATYDSSRVAGISAGVVAMDEALDFGRRLRGQVAPGGHGSMHADEHEVGPEREQAPPAPSPADAHGSAASSEEHQPEAEHAAEHEPVSSLSSGATVALGYAWHYWSGIMFSLSFLVLFGARGWKWAIPYLVLVIYPGMVFAMGSHTIANFIWEAVGHAGFGLTLGIASSALLASDAGQRSGSRPGVEVPTDASRKEQ